MNMSWCLEKWFTSYCMNVNFDPENRIFMIEKMCVGDSYMSILEIAKAVNVNIP